MQKKKFNFILIILIFTSVIVLTVGIFSLLYVFNIFQLKDNFAPEGMAYISLLVTFLDALLCIIFIFIFDKIRQKSDIKMSDVIGSDIKEAYLFGEIGLVVVNEEGIVLWTSDLFQERQIHIVSRNIFEWMPKLRDFLNKDIGNYLIIEYESKTYKVKYLKAAGLFMFKDTTEYEQLLEYNRNKSTCVGIITIDNYNDIVGNSDAVNEVISSVRNNINKYATKFDVLLRSYRNDAYFVICDYSALSNMEKDSFSLIDDIRGIISKETIQPTLSIGFASNFPSINKNNEMASNAIDIALSRGGDQVVVCKYGSELEFYGGKRESIEVNNKVKVRVFSDSLITLISRAANVLIMGHVETDMDAIGSCLGVKVICDYLKKDCRIVYDTKLTERKTRSAFSSLLTRDEVSKTIVSPRDAIDYTKPETLIIVCDVSRPSLTMSPKALEKTDKIVVIDHHRRSSEFIENTVASYIEPGASSTSEIVTEIIKYNKQPNKIPLNNIYATIMLSGIFLDTSFYKSKTTSQRTFEASMILKEYGADNAVADDLLKDEFEEYTLINRILGTLKTPYYGVCYCVCEEDDILERSTLAKVGNQAINLKGINCCFVIGKTSEDEVRISARSDGSINVQLIMEKMNGGGHYSSAATMIKDSTIKQVEENLLDVLENYLNGARSVEME